jgi:hypothetical protein
MDFFKFLDVIDRFVEVETFVMVKFVDIVKFVVEVVHIIRAFPFVTTIVAYNY